MVRAFVVGVFAVLLAGPCVARTLTVGGYMQESREDIKGFNKIWLDGAYGGLTAANGFLVAAGKPPLLCQSSKMAMTNDQILSVLDLYLAAHKTRSDTPVNIVLLRALREAFPCS